jgi:PncC family amidohydrolase
MDECLAFLIQNQFINHGWTLSLAESCTGGNLAARLTSLPGCSHYFLGSIVAYSNELKTKVLGVDAQILATYGAVSAPVVRQMVEGVLKLTGSDYGIAISGLAGPGGGDEITPVGLIWGAIAKQGEDPFVWDFSLSGTRQEIIDKSVDVLLAKLWSFAHF